METPLSILLFFSAILIFGGLLFAIISLRRNSPRTLNQDKYRSQWMSIETKFRKDEAITFPMSIIEADKLLDQALRERGLAGKTMGERMKQRQGKWSNGNGVWAAHKLRNRIAHEADFQVDYVRTKQALLAYKQALKDLGAI